MRASDPLRRTSDFLERSAGVRVRSKEPLWSSPHDPTSPHELMLALAQLQHLLERDAMAPADIRAGSRPLQFGPSGKSEGERARHDHHI